MRHGEPPCLRVPDRTPNLAAIAKKQKQRQQKTAGKPCFWCGAVGGKRTRDHVKPVGVGGKDTETNIVIACEPCNQSRGRLVAFHKEWLKLVRAAVLTCRWRQTVRRFNRRLPAYRSLQDKWAAKERSLLGVSPSAEIEFRVIPDISSPRAIPYPTP